MKLDYRQRRCLNQMLQVTNSLILSGPTGSGKSALIWTYLNDCKIQLSETLPLSSFKTSLVKESCRTQTPPVYFDLSKGSYGSPIFDDIGRITGERRCVLEVNETQLNTIKSFLLDCQNNFKLIKLQPMYFNQVDVIDHGLRIYEEILAKRRAKNALNAAMCEEFLKNLLEANEPVVGHYDLVEYVSDWIDSNCASFS